MLHHDAITATSPTSTLSDYMKRVKEVESLVTEEEQYVHKVFEHFNLSESNQSKREFLQILPSVEVFNPFPHF